MPEPESATTMNDDVRASRARITRRRALGTGATIGLGALLAACAARPEGVASSAPVATAAGTIAPTTEAGADLVAKLDAVGSCAMTAEETQGPYWFDVDSIRSDVREDRPGTLVNLALRVYDAECMPIPDAVVEIWHCDAGGIYSGFEAASTGGGGARPGSGSGTTSNGSYSVGDTEATPGDDGTYLRGAQVADANGIVQFQTIWPGWYISRTVHIHLKVHVNKTSVLTSQLWFDDTLNTAVFQTTPYSSHPGRDTFNEDDSIIDPTGKLTVEKLSEGYLAYTNLGVSA